MTAQPVDDGDELTVDQLASASGLTVRTTRYYASLGLIPPPARRGRMAYYDHRHLARLELVRALQDHGFTLQAIERFLAGLPADASADDLALQRAMLTSWSPMPTERLTRAQLDKKAGRKLSHEEIERLIHLGTLDRDGDAFLGQPNLAVGIELLGLDIPQASMSAAGDAIRRHMESLADELTEILHAQVIQPYREAHGRDETEKLEQTMSRLRQLTQEAVVTGFQRAANAVITRSLRSGS